MHGEGKNLTWVKGSRDNLDEASRKNLAAGRKAKKPVNSTPSGVNGGWSAHPRYYEQKQAIEKELGKEITTADFEANYFVVPESEIQSGTSIFDPVLCELAYSWFCPPDGKVLDPFAGGSVRGIVANYLGRHYTGIDLRPEQIAANEAQAKTITPDNMPRWICGNSLTDIPQEQFDFVFSCPPYYDLEVYSEDAEDLSTFKTYEAFLTAYREIIKQCVDRLSDDRFACFCVGDIRDKKGIYRNFVSDTIAAFQCAGAQLYNEAILVTSVGSLPIRVGRQFDAGRKLGKTHQNVLFFVKGKPKKATQNCGKVEIGDLAEAYGEIA